MGNVAVDWVASLCRKPFPGFSLPTLSEEFTDLLDRPGHIFNLHNPVVDKLTDDQTTNSNLDAEAVESHAAERAFGVPLNMHRSVFKLILPLLWAAKDLGLGMC